MEFERGDVVWGVDPFKQDSDLDSESSRDDGGVAPRPWLIISTDSVPFHPEQYLCLTLTTRTWHDESTPLSAESWVEGGAPERSSIMPWSISAIQHRFLDTTGDLVARLDSIPDDDVPADGYQGQLTKEVTAEATQQVVNYLEATLTT
ncbi:type II toxin-antitoxin system PemK/MazF family toxin [Haloterrigena sp. H1]|nr:type II toxin-antitoxin system PemK/MazF family toxin [Haloterrigena sp. H1]